MPGISIQIDAIDNASGILGNVFAAIKSGAGTMDYIAIAASAAAAVVKDSIKSYVEYADQVREMARATGTSVEEASRLIQVADDAQISVESLTMAMRLGIKNGIDPSIEGLARLSDEYLALAPGVDRGQFLMDKFGKSGLEMGKLLSIGSQGLLEMNAAVDSSLILTQEAIDKAREYQISVDALNDAWMGFKQTTGQAVLPALTTLLNSIRDGTRANELLTESGVNAEFASYKQRDAALAKARAEREAADANLLGADAANQGGDAFLTEAEQAKVLKDQLDAAEAAIKATTAANTQLFGLVGSLQAEQKNYNAQLADTIVKYGAESEEVLKLKAAHIEAMNAIAYSLYVAKLQADGFTDAEYNMAIAAGVAMGQIDQASADTALALNQIATAATNSAVPAAEVGKIISSAMADGVVSEKELQDALNKFDASPIITELAAVTDAVNAIPKYINIQAEVTYTNTGIEGVVHGYASGTSDFAGGLALVGEKGPELVSLPKGSQIFSNQESMDMMSAGQTVNIYGPVTLTLQNPESLVGMR